MGFRWGSLPGPIREPSNAADRRPRRNARCPRAAPSCAWHLGALSKSAPLACNPAGRSCGTGSTDTRQEKRLALGAYPAVPGEPDRIPERYPQRCPNNAPSGGAAFAPSRGEAAARRGAGAAGRGHRPRAARRGREAGPGRDPGNVLRAGGPSVVGRLEGRQDRAVCRLRAGPPEADVFRRSGIGPCPR